MATARAKEKPGADALATGAFCPGKGNPYAGANSSPRHPIGRHDPHHLLRPLRGRLDHHRAARAEAPEMVGRDDEPAIRGAAAFGPLGYLWQ